VDPAGHQGNRSEAYQNVSQTIFLLQNLPMHRDYRKIPPNKSGDLKILQFAAFSVGCLRGAGGLGGLCGLCGFLQFAGGGSGS